MRNKINSSTILLGALGLLLSGAPALAQKDSENERESVTVTAPYIVHKKVNLGIYKQASLAVLSVSRNVSYVDLDLAKPAEAQILIERIKTAAAGACKELDKRFAPEQFLPMPNQDCVGAATSESLMVANRLIAASAAH